MLVSSERDFGATGQTFVREQWGLCHFRPKDGHQLGAAAPKTTQLCTLRPTQTKLTKPKQTNVKQEPFPLSANTVTALAQEVDGARFMPR